MHRAKSHQPGQAQRGQNAAEALTGGPDAACSTTTPRQRPPPPPRRPHPPNRPHCGYTPKPRADGPPNAPARRPSASSKTPRENQFASHAIASPAATTPTTSDKRGHLPARRDRNQNWQLYPLPSQGQKSFPPCHSTSENTTQTYPHHLRPLPSTKRRKAMATKRKSNVPWSQPQPGIDARHSQQGDGKQGQHFLPVGATRRVCPSVADAAYYDTKVGIAWKWRT